VFRREKAVVAKPEAKQAIQAPSERSDDSSGFRRYAYRHPVKPGPGNRSAAEPVFVRGTRLQSSERFEEAIESYREAARLDPAYFEAYYNWGLAAASSGNTDSALQAYEMALAIRPESVDARYNFGVVLKQANCIADAAQELERILRENRNEVRAHLILGNIYAQQLRQPGKAQEHYSKVLELDPRNAQAQAIRYWMASRRP
jgi:tetratricopeptide (TPR) repeat protein